MALEGVFFDIGLVIIVATLLALAAALFRQPLILAYVITGLVIGPLTGLVSDSALIIGISELGIAFLLFLVGLEMDVRKLKSVGLSASVAGLGQVMFASLSGFFLLLALGFSRVEAVYLAVALSFCSTMIVVKLLSDKGELDTLHGRMLVGILLVQDVVAIFSLALVNNAGSYSVYVVAGSLLKGFALFAAAFLSGRFVLPPIFRLMAKSQELLFMASISWCFAFAIYAHSLGYSIAIGAFLAGVSLASLKYSFEIMSRVKSLRDFFATIFFVSLGMQMVFLSPSGLVKNSIILSAFVVFFNPLIVLLLMSFMGYNKKVSFLSGAGISQISEFSLILVALGVSLGHLGAEILSLVSVVAIITITITAYTIKYNTKLYSILSGLLSVFPKIAIRRVDTGHIPVQFKPDVILCGQNRIGYSVYNKLKQMRKSFLVVDYNPEIIKGLVKEKIPCIYGDAGDIDIIEKMQLRSVEMLISTVPDIQSNSLIIKKLKEKNRAAIIIVTADHVDDALRLYQEGADYVIMPHFLGGDHASMLVEDFRDLNAVLKARLDHIVELNKRKLRGIEHQ